MSIEVNKDEHADKIARMMSGFCGVPPIEQERMIQRVAKLYAEQSSLLREAREALEKYGEHDSKCDGINCFCGLNKAIDKIKGVK